MSNIEQTREQKRITKEWLAKNKGDSRVMYKFIECEKCDRIDKHIIECLGEK